MCVCCEMKQRHRCKIHIYTYICACCVWKVLHCWKTGWAGLKARLDACLRRARESFRCCCKWWINAGLHPPRHAPSPRPRITVVQTQMLLFGPFSDCNRKVLAIKFLDALIEFWCTAAAPGKWWDTTVCTRAQRKRPWNTRPDTQPSVSSPFRSPRRQV